MGLLEDAGLGRGAMKRFTTHRAERVGGRSNSKALLGGGEGLRRDRVHCAASVSSAFQAPLPGGTLPSRPLPTRRDGPGKGSEAPQAHRITLGESMRRSIRETGTERAAAFGIASAAVDTKLCAATSNTTVRLLLLATAPTESYCFLLPLLLFAASAACGLSNTTFSMLQSPVSQCEMEGGRAEGKETKLQ